MKKFKTLTALCVALATMVSANASLAASAATVDPELAQREAFVSSYSNDMERAAAQLYLDLGASLSDAKDMMDVYISGEKEIQESRAAASKNRRLKAGAKGYKVYDTGTTFYNGGTRISKNPHYAVVIVDDASQEYETTLKLTYNTDWLNVGNALEAKTLNGYENIRTTKKTNTVKFFCHLNPLTNNKIPMGVVQIPFSATKPSNTTECLNEATLYHKFTFTRVMNSVDDPNSGTDSTFRYETYVKGDANHDGLVTNADSTYVTNYMLNVNNYPVFHYTNVHENIAKIVNDLAMDYDDNGVVELADMILINKNKD